MQGLKYCCYCYHCFDEFLVHWLSLFLVFRFFFLSSVMFNWKSKTLNSCLLGHQTRFQYTVHTDYIVGINFIAWLLQTILLKIGSFLIFHFIAAISKKRNTWAETGSNWPEFKIHTLTYSRQNFPHIVSLFLEKYPGIPEICIPIQEKSDFILFGKRQKSSHHPVVCHLLGYLQTL